MTKTLYKKIMKYELESKSLVNDFINRHKKLWEKIKNDNIEEKIKYKIIECPVLSIVSGFIMSSTEPLYLLKSFKKNLDLSVEYLLKIKSDENFKNGN